MAKMTYDYNIIKRLGEKLDSAKIQDNFYLVFSQIKNQDKDLFVAPHTGARAFKLKNESELNDFFKSSYYKPKDVEFFAISRKEKLTSAPEKTKSESSINQASEPSLQEESVYLEIMKKFKNESD